MSDSPTIRVEGLWKVFGPHAERLVGSPDADLSRSELRAKTGCTVAVKDVTFEVDAGEVFVVMGLSGSGKSTLVRCLTRLVDPTAGRVWLGGEDILAASGSRLREVRRTKFSMVFQHFGLLPHRRVIDNIAYALEVNGVSRDARHARAREVIELVGLQGYEQAYPEQLSGGMQQRVGLARALAVDPEVMFLDEPFSDLDPLIRRDMQAEVMRLHRDLAIMRDGAIVQVGTPEELIANPVDDYVADFTQDIPKSHVLTLRSIARPASADEQAADPALPASTIVRDATSAILAADGPVRVVDGDAEVGVVGPSDVLRLVSGERR